MNRVTIIGRLTADPELRMTTAGKSVCNFNVAVNRRTKVEGQPDADFFRVCAWGQLAEICNKYTAKGRKVAVVGSISLRQYKGQDGKERANMEIMASEVEFLSPRETQHEERTEPMPVDMPEEGLPF